MIWLILVLVLLGLCPQAAPARQKNLQFKHITSNDGLTHNTVYAVFQDKRGFMWFGTQEGLNRYDGYEIKTYRNEPGNPKSIDYNWISYINEDSEGSMWVCTSGGGINRYNFETDTFDHVFDFDDPDLADINVVRNFTEDKDGFLWIGTDAGVFRLDKESGQSRRYEYESERPGSLSDNTVRHVFVDSRGTLWVSTHHGGLNRYQAETDSFIKYRHDPEDDQSISSDRVAQVYEDHKGTLWVPTANGLNRYLPDQDGFEKFFFEEGVAGSLSNSYLNIIREDARKNLWVGTYNGGLNLYNRSTGLFEHFKHHPARMESLSNDKISSIWEDHAGTLWVGTEHCVNFVDLESGYFKHLKHDATINQSLSDNEVYEIHADPFIPEILWVGTESGGLNKVHVKSGDVAYFQNKAGDPSSLSNNFVQSILVDHRGRLWTGTRHGLNLLDQDRGTFTHFLLASEGRFSDRIRIIYEAPSEPGVLWIAGGGGGLVRFEVESERVDRYPHNPSDEYSMCGDWVSSIYEDQSDQLWIGTSGNGLCRFNRSTRTFTRYPYDENRPFSLASKHIDGIAETAQGTLWLATENGLVQFDVERNEFQHYTDRNSNISSNAIRGVVADEKDKLWISTNAGVSRFDPVTKVFDNYDVEQGLQGRAFNARVYHQDKAGNIYFGGLNGLNVFHPDDIKGNPHAPKLLLTDMSLFDEELVPGEDTSLLEHVSVAKKISLSHDQNEISIGYTGLHYSSPLKNQYQVKLESYDADWRAVNRDRRVTYTSLDPGTYTFKVKAANANGVWSEELSGIEITINSPWWLKPWAFLIYTIMLGGIVFYVDRYQRAKLIQKEREAAQIREAELRMQAAELKSQASESQARALKAENEQKEAELQKAAELKEAYEALQDSMDQLKIAQRQLVQAEKMASLGQLTAGIAHEIKNPLNFVVNFAVVSQNLIREMESMLQQENRELDAEAQEEMKEMLSLLILNTERINEHGLRADSIVKSMMEHSRPSDGLLVDVSLTRVLNQAIDFAYTSLTNEVGASEIVLEKKFDESIGLVKLNAQDFTRVIINLLENAFYAVKESAVKEDVSKEGDRYIPRICVSTALVENQIEIKIEDNGAGIDEEVKSKIFDPFYTTKPTGFGNTGLGLSLSYDIIAQGHNGTITVGGKKGEGAIFTVIIPAM